MDVIIIAAVCVVVLLAVWLLPVIWNMRDIHTIKKALDGDEEAIAKAELLSETYNLIHEVPVRVINKDE